jgi:hypothetical protein
MARGRQPRRAAKRPAPSRGESIGGVVGGDARYGAAVVGGDGRVPSSEMPS